MTDQDEQRRLLVADDEPGIREFLVTAFEDKGFAVQTAANGDKAIELIQETAFDVVITDLKMPGRDGLAVLRAVKEMSVDTLVIMITAHGTIETAVEAMRLGAQDFIAKPFGLEEIERKVERGLKRLPPRDQAPKPEDQEPARTIVGESKETKNLLKTIYKIGPTRSSVLITGPTGTGKELVARAIHDASPRRNQPFIALNCAALAQGVLESELFGHEKGAFTGATGRRVGRFERAHDGTLFLDEVAEINPGTQLKLLRVLQEGEFERVGGAEPIKVDARIVAATNRDLREAISDGSFREDFYYRLNVFSIQVEPLRQRPDDIPSLIEHFLGTFCADMGKTITGIEDEVIDLFMRYPWPGNVRELEHVLERAAVLTDGPTITREDIPQDMFFLQEQPEPEPERSPEPQPVAEDASLVERTGQMESEIIRAALEKFHWNKTKTAEHLGLKRTTLQYKIKKYGIE